MDFNKDLYGLNVRLLKSFMIWPSKNKFNIAYFWKAITFFALVYLSAFTVLLGFLRQLFVNMDDVEVLIESGIGILDAGSFIYMRICFGMKMKSFQFLVEELKSFEEYCGKEELLKAEAQIRRFSKALFFYCLFGNAVNAIIPIIDRENCNKRRVSDLLRERDPCGVMCRCYYPFDVSHELFPFVYVLQLYTCTVISMVVITLTLMQIAVFMHTIAQIHHLRNLIKELSKFITADDLKLKVENIIKYHQKIIKYTQHINEAFSSMMLFHLTFTSIVISVLGFEVIMVDNLTDSLRFGLHLFGWLVLLLLVCYYGQLLIDESVAVATDIYFIPWYEAPMSVQKDLMLILLRSQKPLKLVAANIGVMSLPTFLTVMSSAYSYFTLLVKIKA